MKTNTFPFCAFKPQTYFPSVPKGVTRGNYYLSSVYLPAYLTCSWCQLRATVAVVKVTTGVTRYDEQFHMYRYVHTVKKIKSRFGNRQEKELTGFSLSSFVYFLVIR